METQQEKKTLKDLFQNKQFRMALPVLLILVGSFCWYIFKDTSVEASPAQTSLNGDVPMAMPDSSRLRNKLDLQSDIDVTGSASTTSPIGSVNVGPTGGMQRQIPGAAEPYVYGQNRYQRPTTNVPTAIETESQYTTGLPTNLKPGPARGTTPMLKESDVLLSEEHVPTENSSGKNEAQLKAEYDQAVKKRDKLTSLLEQYNRDKAKFKTAEDLKKEVTKTEPTSLVTSLNGPANTRNTFNGLVTEDAQKAQRALLEAETGTIRAVIYSDQDVVQSGRVELRLLDDIQVRGVVIPRNSLIYGTGSFGTERVQIAINTIQYQNKLFPVHMTVYDNDGMVGVYVPNINGLPEARQAIGQGVSSINLNTGFGGVNAGTMAALAGAQAGIQGIKQVANKKFTTQKAHLKNNHFVLLRSNEPGKTAEAPSF